MPSTYSHDPVSQTRVAQYQPIPTPNRPEQVLRSSGYTHTRSSLAYGQSADNYHRVESWGDPVRPYGEWRFPYRPYSVPYGAWGAPLAGLNLGRFVPGYGYGRGGGQSYYGGPGSGRRPVGESPSPEEDDDETEDNILPNIPYDPWPLDRRRPGWNPNQGNPHYNNGSLNPYPAGPGTPYPVAPYYDGYYPNYRD